MKKLSSYIRYFNPISKKIGYMGWLGFKNLGDEALFEAVTELMNPIATVQVLKFYRKGKFIEKLAERFCYDAVMLGGGTLINSAGYLDKLLYFQKKGFKTFVFGAGVLDPVFYSRFDEYPNVMYRWVDCLNSCDFVGVRGPLSKEILSKYGYHDAVICGDPVFYFAEDHIPKKRRGKTIGINVGTTWHGRYLYGGSDEKVIKFTKKLATVLIELGYDIMLFPVFQDDIEVTKEVLQVSPGNISMVVNHHDLHAYMKSLDEVDIFIGEKLHSVIIALCKYIPSIMLAYRPKCLDLMESIGSGKFAVKTNKLDIDNIIYLVKEIEENYLSYQEHVVAEIANYKNKLIVSSGQIKDILQS